MFENYINITALSFLYKFNSVCNFMANHIHLLSGMYNNLSSLLADLFKVITHTSRDLHNDPSLRFIREL